VGRSVEAAGGVEGVLAAADGEAGEEDRWRSAASSRRWCWRASTPGSLSARGVPVLIERAHRMLDADG
jgi:hypothetical protein